MRLNVVRFGTDHGPPVVCLHGVMGNANRFRSLAAAALSDRAVLSLDLRGHGDSGWEPPWNLDAFLDDLRETLDAEALGQVDLIGFSFGGRLALELAAADPDRARRLVLLDPAVQMPAAAAAAFADAYRPDITFADQDEAVEVRMSGLAHAPRDLVERDIDGSLIPAVDGRVRYPVSQSAVIAAYGEMARVPRLPTDHPTLLVRAADGIVDDRQEHLLRASLGSRLTVLGVPGTHSVMWDAFDATADAVALHLGEGR